MRNSNRRESGFSLVELLVATLLFLILIGPLLSFIRAGQIGRSTSIRLSDVEQNARAAMLSISRDIQNAGFNFAPRVDLKSSPFLRPLVSPSGSTTLTPIIPGNDLNLVKAIDSTGVARTNKTDQITFVSISQSFNNGLPLSGTISALGDIYTSDATFGDIYSGDFVLLSSGQKFAIGVITDITGNIIRLQNGDIYGLNQTSLAAAGPLTTLDPAPQIGLNISLYKFQLVSYFVDENGNLIRREQLPPPHTTQGGVTSITPAQIVPDINTYTCSATSQCQNDSVIATGVEDLQFKYFLADPGATGVSGLVNDPGYYGSAAGGATTPNLGVIPNFRLLDIRQIKVSIKTRALERDTKIPDPYNPKQGYLYRFTLEGTFNTRNFYGADYRPL
jgi:hypothetical protein